MHTGLLRIRVLYKRLKSHTCLLGKFVFCKVSQICSRQSSGSHACMLGQGKISGQRISNNVLLLIVTIVHVEVNVS